MAGCSWLPKELIPVDNTCTVDWRQFPRKGDFFTRASAEEKVQKNCTWENLCLPPEQRNERCPQVDDTGQLL